MGVIKLLARAMTALNAFLMTTTQEWLFVQGKSFSFEDYFNIDALGGGNDTIDIVLDSSAFTGDNLTFTPPLFASDVGPITIEYFTGTVASDDGIILGASNRREGMPNPVSVLRRDPTISDDGTRFSGDLIVSTTGILSQNGTGNIPGLPFEINSSVKHMIRIKNTNGQAGLVQIKMTWFEA